MLPRTLKWIKSTLEAHPTGELSPEQSELLAELSLLEEHPHVESALEGLHRDMVMRNLAPAPSACPTCGRPWDRH